MKVTATRQEGSVICTLPEGKELEIIMVCAEGEDHSSEPDIKSAPGILEALSRAPDSQFCRLLD